MSKQPSNRSTETAPTAVDGDAARVIGVLAWALEHGVELASVSVSSAGCTVTLARAVAREPREPAPDPRTSMYRQFGGEMFRRAVVEGDVDENGLVPVVGR